MLLFATLFITCLPGFSETQKLTFCKKMIPDEAVVIRGMIITKGRIYVKTSKPTILVIDHHGRTLKRIGRRGEGPGEFQYLSDFCITGKEIFVAGYKKISTFNLNGSLLKEVRTSEIIENIVTSEKIPLYLSKKFNRQTRKYNLNLKNLANQTVCSFPDESRVHAKHPSGKSLPFPWMVAPFANKMVCLCGKDGIFRLFFTRKDYFYVVEGENLKEVSFNYSFNPAKIVRQDIEDFWSQIEKGTKQKMPASTRRSVKFPDTKVLFMGVISWDQDLALVHKDHFSIFTTQGEFKTRINYPPGINYYKHGDSNEFVPKQIVKFGNYVYITDEEHILIYQLK